MILIKLQREYSFRQWYPERIHKIACWEIGDLEPGEHNPEKDLQYEYIAAKQGHIIMYKGDPIKIYVLKEILGA